MREVLYQVDWQVKRINTLKDLHVLGGWSTWNGMMDNLDTFTDYLNEDVEHDVRRYRVHNMLNAVVMGYHGQRVGASVSDSVNIDLRIETVRLYKDGQGTGKYNRKNVEMASMLWNWDEQYQKLRELYKADAARFTYLLDNLSTRSSRGTRETRPELDRFVRLMQRAIL